MGLFSRRRKEPMDADLTFMTVSEADELRELARDALAGLGVEASIDGGDVRTDEGSVFGLWNVATVCGSSDREQWPQIVAEHVRNVAVAVSSPSPEEMTAEQLLAAVTYRLSEESYVRTMPDQPADVQPFAPGLVRHLVVDTPESVITAPEDVLTATAPLPELREAADRNTRRLFDDIELESELFGDDDARVRVVIGESLFTATMALYLPQIVHHFDPQADLTRGIVFAVPTRHQIVYHLPTSADSVRDVLPSLLRFAATGYDEGAGPLSPELYQQHGEHVSVLTAPGPNGRVTITPVGALHDLLEDAQPSV